MGLNFFIDPFDNVFPCPSLLSVMKLWLKADGSLYQDSARTTPVTANDDPVGSWTDESGNGNHVSQATAANKPLFKTGIVNGKPTVRFDGTNDFMTRTFGAALTQPNTIFVVHSYSGNANNYVYDGVDGSNRHAMGQGVITPLNPQIYAGNGIGQIQSPPSPVQIWSCVYNAASGNFYKPSTGSNAVGDTGTQAMGGITLGARFTTISDFLTGDITELLVFNSSLSLSDQNCVGNYLEAKYALTYVDR